MPVEAKVLATSPKMPSGARRITQRTSPETASETSANARRVVSLALRSSSPSPTAQVRMPMKLASISAWIGLSTALMARLRNISAMPVGGVPSAWGASMISEVGKRKLAVTATSAATSVPIR